MSHEVLLTERRAASQTAIRTLEAYFKKELTGEQSALAGTTLYITGSTARGEMSKHSDIELFIVRLEGKRSRLDEAALVAALCRALAKMQKPAPSQDGRFLRMQLASKLVKELGTERDDFYNHFTARMLLLLESRPLIQGDLLYEALIDQVLVRYWKDSDLHPGNHIPYLLVNDIVRYWRILLLNYAAKVGARVRTRANTGSRAISSASVAASCASPRSHISLLPFDAQATCRRR